MIRVLVVDDHPVLRAGLEAVLRAEPGFVCVGVASDGDDARRVLPRTKPDVVILDRRLGEEDGLALCEAMRSQPGAPEFVVYTADAADADLESLARAAGACGVVEKNRPIDELFDALRLAARARSHAV